MVRVRISIRLGIGLQNLWTIEPSDCQTGTARIMVFSMISLICIPVSTTLQNLFVFDYLLINMWNKKLFCFVH